MTTDQKRAVVPHCPHTVVTVTTGYMNTLNDNSRRPTRWATRIYQDKFKAIRLRHGCRQKFISCCLL